MPATYIHTYFVIGNDIFDEKDGARNIGTFYGGAEYYCRIEYDNIQYDVDLSFMLRRESGVDPNQSLSAFLTARLTTVTAIDSYSTNKIPARDVDGRYRTRITSVDGFMCQDYDIAYTSMAFPSIKSEPQYYALAMDLVLTPARNDVDLSNTLVSVNGVLHRTVLYQGALYVLGGFFNMKNSKKRLVSVYDTGPVGGHTTVAITASMVEYDTAAPENLFRGFYLNMPTGISLKDKTVFLVLNGRLHALDGSYMAVSEKRIKVNTNHLDLITNFLVDPNTVYARTGVLPPTDNPFIDPNYIPPGGIGPLRPIVTPSIQEQLGDFFSGTWSTIEDNIAKPGAAVVQYSYNLDGQEPSVQQIENAMPVSGFLTPSFILSNVLSQRSFLVIINNRRIYRRRYVLKPMVGPDHYEWWGQDTPRGIMMQQRRDAIPYMFYSSQGGQHVFSLGHHKERVDLWKTAPISADPETGNPVIPSPVFNPKNIKQTEAVEIFDFLSPTAGS